ncbi:hypothetical protein SNE40_019430 [Patella caerulea]|uniref:CUB domain-containing protein n=1 Tax=Patella caerulea TaxID=87958 RepID=A0AAN8J712_PATCE
MNRFMKFVILMLMGINIVNSYTETEYMNTNCGETVYVSDSNIIKLQPYMIGYMDDDCEVTVEALLSSKIQLSFLDFDVPCDEGSVVIGGYSYGDVSTETCSRTKPTQTYKSFGDSLTIKFKKEDHVTSPVSHFRILATQMHTGFCASYEFECNNYNCIDKYDLACDGYDNCGDNSDEVKGCVLQPGAIAGIVIGSFAFVFLVFIISVAICRKKRYGSVLYTNRTPAAVHVNTNQGIAQPYFIQPPTSYPMSPPQYTQQPPQYSQEVPQYRTQPTPPSTTQCPPPAYELSGCPTKN